MAELPSGTVTFLFTDIEGSTQLLQQLGKDRYAALLAEHHELMRAAFQAHGGHEIDTQGDAFFVTFGRATDAIAAVVAAQRALASHTWPEDTTVRVRMGLHTGEAALTATGYVGLDVHRAARICSAGHGGQILLSQTTRALLSGELPVGASMRDLGPHRLKDLQQPEQVFQLVIADLPADFPTLKSLDAWPNNLPAQLTSFIGREHEMAEVKQLLNLNTTRLLTLTGMGGCGKTRLAIQVAADLVEEYPDGVWLVELATLADPTLVPQTVAATLNVREVQGRPLLSALCDYLQPKELLLILDNCEHLIEACAQLVEALLRGCPKLKILATSRELLSASGERAWRVPPLSLPDPQRPPTIEDLTQCETVQLFIERARATLSTFAVTDQNAPALVQICRRLDGIPLAIELAAARVKVLSVEQIAARLDDRFKLLTGGSRTAVRRQQTLQAAIDWSYSLLMEKERGLLRRLSIFADGCTIEAAEAVCTGEGIEEHEVLDLLTQLVDKSLASKEEAGGAARYRLLETIRQYGQEKVMEAGEAAALRGRHLDFFVKFAEHANPHLRGADQKIWLERLEMEHDNLRAALEWSQAEVSSRAVGLQLAEMLSDFWHVRGYLTEGRRWLEALLVATESDRALASVRAKALRAAGMLASDQGDYESARALHEASLATERELGNKRGVAYSLNNLGAIAHNHGEYERAIALYEESLALKRELEDKRGIAVALTNLGTIASDQGDYERAIGLFEESLTFWREQGDTLTISAVLNNLGAVAERKRDYGQAAALYKESLALRKELRDKQGIAISLLNLAEVAGAQGQLERAARLFGASEALREVINTPLAPSDRPSYERKVDAVRASLNEEVFVAAWAEGRAMTLEQAVEYSLKESCSSGSIAPVSK